MKTNLLGLSFLSIALLLLGVYPLGWFWCAWCAWIPIFLLAESLSEKPGKLLLFIFMIFVVYYGIGSYWLLYYQTLLFFAITFVAAAIVALYFGLYHLLTRKSRSTLFKILCAFSLWPLLQYLIRLTPITTALFEAPFLGPLEFFQVAAIVDYSCFGALIFTLSLSIVLYARNRRLKNALWIVMLSTCLAGLYVWGHHRLQMPSNQKLSHAIKVALIQHNIPVSGEWRFDHPDEIRGRYKQLALKAAISRPDLIIFPLYDFPDDPLRKPEFFSALAKGIGTPILVASHIPEIPGKSIFQYGYQNVAVLYASDGRVLDHYQSVGGAPSFSMIKEHNADKYRVMNSPFGKLGILLCYEDARPKFAQTALRQGARVLIALSNPGFFSKTHMPYYHLIQDRLRAIETGLPLLRVSSNGYSAQVDPRGRFLQKSALEEEDILLAEI